MQTGALALAGAAIAAFSVAMAGTYMPLQTNGTQLAMTDSGAARLKHSTTRKQVLPASVEPSATSHQKEYAPATDLHSEQPSRSKTEKSDQPGAAHTGRRKSDEPGASSPRGQ